MDQFYLLVRTKKGKAPEDRLADIFGNYVSIINIYLKM